MFLLIIYALLILLCSIGLFGLFFCRNYMIKISYLSVSYISFVVFVTLISLKNEHLFDILSILVSVMVIFSINLLIAIGIAKNITQAQ